MPPKDTTKMNCPSVVNLPEPVRDDVTRLGALLNESDDYRMIQLTGAQVLRYVLSLGLDAAREKHDLQEAP